jgi:putative salt-induced outer membrane protein YdiY
MCRLGLLATLFLAACVSRPVEPVENKPQVTRQAWEPPEPDPKDWDWIKLNTGEWLKGDIETMRDRDFEFDSDKLDSQRFDWADIHELRSPRQNTVVLDDKTVHRGTILIKDGTVAMKTKDGTQHFSRAEILSIVPGKKKMFGLWSGKVSVGVTARSGNTNQVESNAQIFIRRRSPFSRVDFNYLGNYSALDETPTIDNHRFTGRWDIFLSKRWFATPISLDLFRDRFQNIAAQVTPGAGGGYRVVDTGKVEWELDLAGGYRITEYDSVLPGTPSSESTAVIIPGTKLEWDLTSDIEFKLSYMLQVGIPDTADTNHHFVMAFSFDILKDIDLDLTFQWDHIGQPRPDANGNIPFKDDYRTIVSLGWEF